MRNENILLNCHVEKSVFVDDVRIACYNMKLRGWDDSLLGKVLAMLSTGT